MPLKTYTDLSPDSYDVHQSIIDTSTLMVFLGLSFLASQPKEPTASQRQQIFRFIGIEDFEDDSVKQQRYQSLLTRINEIVTTSHVIGELSSHITRGFGSNDMMREDFLRHTIQMLTEKRIQETLVTIMDISIGKQYNDILIRIGIVDMGLLSLAQRLDLPLLTQDGRTLGSEADRLPDVVCFVLPFYF